MKQFTICMVVFALILSACSSQSTPQAATVELKVGDGSTTKTYSVDALKNLGAAKASFKGVEYVGVTLTDLLKDAGFDPAQLKAVKVIAIDGFSVNYEPALFTRPDTLLAYAQSGGPLTAEDGNFRRVLPAQEGKLNPRMVVEIQAVK